MDVKRVVPWIFVALWMAFIFNMSHKPAPVSNEISTGITEKIIEVVEKVVPDAKAKIDAGRWNHVVRKNAHFFSYAVLGMLVANGLRKNGVKGPDGLAPALIICILYAITDEIHQVFIPGRGGQLKDVMIDGTGAILGIALFCYQKLCLKRNQ